MNLRVHFLVILYTAGRTLILLSSQYHCAYVHAHACHDPQMQAGSNARLTTLSSSATGFRSSSRRHDGTLQGRGPIDRLSFLHAKRVLKQSFIGSLLISRCVHMRWNPWRCRRQHDRNAMMMVMGRTEDKEQSKPSRIIDVAIPRMTAFSLILAMKILFLGSPLRVPQENPSRTGEADPPLSLL